VASVVSVHSFRGGTGKSNLTANVAAQLVAGGARVAMVDTDIQSPGIHVLFGLENTVGPTLNDFLWGTGAITDVAIDVTDRIRAHVAVPDPGALHLVRSSINAGDIARVLHEGYDVARLRDGFRELGDGLDVDVVLVDTHPGLNEETLLSIMISDALILILRPDRQDFEGTAVTVGVAQRLKIPALWLVCNKVPGGVDMDDLADTLATNYGAEIAAILPLSEEVARNASGDLFSLLAPHHEWSRSVTAIADKIRSLRA
jgi:MinD-like ATPase involved in chromosome partitioning or flagellar assembly